MIDTEWKIGGSLWPCLHHEELGRVVAEGYAAGKVAGVFTILTCRDDTLHPDEKKQPAPVDKTVAILLVLTFVYCTILTWSCTCNFIVTGN